MIVVNADRPAADDDFGRRSLAAQLKVKVFLMETQSNPEKKSRVRLLFVLVCCFTFVSETLAAQDEVGIKRGTQAPAVQVEDLDGKPVDLGELVGSKPLLMEFWAIWCDNCEALAPKMQQVHELYGDEIEVVAVAVKVGQSRRKVKRHIKKHPVDYRFLFDKKGAAVKAYSAPATAYVVIVDAAGRVAYTGTGGNQDLVGEVKAVLHEDQPAP